jgi:uncharacterized protein YukE
MLRLGRCRPVGPAKRVGRTARRGSCGIAGPVKCNWVWPSWRRRSALPVWNFSNTTRRLRRCCEVSTMAEPFQVDPEALAEAVQCMGEYLRYAENMLTEIGSLVTNLHGTWSGEAAQAHAQAHRHWAHGEAMMREALTLLKAAGTTEHANYTGVMAANLGKKPTRPNALNPAAAAFNTDSRRPDTPARHRARDLLRADHRTRTIEHVFHTMQHRTERAPACRGSTRPQSARARSRHQPRIALWSSQGSFRMGGQSGQPTALCGSYTGPVIRSRSTPSDRSP